MGESGPSREELENYFKNSRAYFDELAKHYYETDREYYDKYIRPFYSPFGGAVRSGKSAPRVAMLVAVFFLVIAGAAVSFFLTMSSDREKSEDEKRIEDVREKIKKEAKEKSSAEDTVSVKRKTASDYEKGLEFYRQEDYSNAERYFKRVPSSDKNYDDAQEKLKEIQKQKETDKDSRYVRPKPKERVR